MRQIYPEVQLWKKNGRFDIMSVLSFNFLFNDLAGNEFSLLYTVVYKWKQG